MTSAGHQLRQLIQQYGLERFDQWRDVLYWLEYESLDDAACQFYLMEVQEHILTLKDSGNWLYRCPHSEEELYGPGPIPELILGRLVEKPEIPLGLKIPPSRHILVTGSSGAGKSTTLRTLVAQLECREPSDVRILYVDPKADARDFPATFGPHWLILNEDNIRMGLNAPEYIPVNKWIDVIAEILAARCGMRLSKTCFVGIVKFLVGLLYQGNRGGAPIFPSLREVLQAVQIKPIAEFYSARADYIKTLTQVLNAILHESSEIFDCRGGLDINQLFAQGRHVIINSAAMAQSTTMILVDILLMQLLQSRLIHRNHQWPFVLVIIDEADTLLDPGRGHTDENYPHSMTPLQRVLRLGRELDLLACIGISDLIEVNHHVTTNMTYQICHRTTDSRALYCAMQSLQLQKGCEHLLSGLGPGQAIFKQALPSWHRPFLVQIDYHPTTSDPNPTLDRCVVDSALPAQDLYDIPGIEQEIHRIAQANNKTRQREIKATTGNKLYEDSIRTLKQATRMLYRPFLEVFRKLKITNSGYQDKICDTLAQQGLVEFEELNF